MRESRKIQQAKACLLILKSNANDIFCKHKLTILENAIKQAEYTFAQLTALDAQWRKERRESNKALSTLTKRSLYYSELLKMELPHLDVIRSLEPPTNLAEEEYFADSIIEVIANNPDLYFAQEGLDELLVLESAFDKEQEEADSIKEVYHQFVQEKNKQLTNLEKHINDTKRFTRRSFGRTSRQYQSIKNAMFTRKSTTPKTEPTPTENTTPTTNDQGE